MSIGMLRIARVVIPGMPHPVTQRGNRRANALFADEDREADEANAQAGRQTKEEVRVRLA